MGEKKRKEIKQKEKDEEEEKVNRSKKQDEEEKKALSEFKKKLSKRYKDLKLVKQTPDKIPVENPDPDKIDSTQISTRKISLPRKLQTIPNSTKYSTKMTNLINGKAQEETWLDRKSVV